MKLAEILPEIEKGRRAKRSCWPSEDWWSKESTAYLTPRDIFTDDWELEPEPEKLEMEPIYFQEFLVNENGQLRYANRVTKVFPTKEQRRALTYAIRDLFKEFEGETE